MKKPLRVAIAGMGGFAYCHHEALRVLETSGEARLVATCDLQPQRFAAQQETWEFEARGVQVYDDFLAMLDRHQGELDFVTPPTPIPLHASMHRACVEHGLACYLEKPPTLVWSELEAMIAVDKKARHAAQVGFNYIAEAPRQHLKTRLLAGEFGPLKRAGFVGRWPRAATYFERAAWAGRLMQGQQLVLDSCTGNAMAHFLHNLLFWCGQDELFSWAPLQVVEAELYRAYEIESFDTCFARGFTPQGIEVLLATTHAGGENGHHREWLECERAAITYLTSAQYEIHWKDGRIETGATERGTLLEENLRHYIRYLRGEVERPLTLLQDARPFVELHNLLFVAADGITSIQPSHLNRNMQNGQQFTSIQGLEEVMEEFAHTSRMPGELGVDWGRVGGSAGLMDLPRLQEVVQVMKAQYDQEQEELALEPAQIRHFEDSLVIKQPLAA